MFKVDLQMIIPFLFCYRQFREWFLWKFCKVRVTMLGVRELFMWKIEFYLE